ncbi:MAG TPA: SDR family NAD(P)-dependent oxidoreductase [Steroidobacteraceae bacterium]|nr:SDR family NAD(P)-dependent oxidoreductase [Steroidobacteraceae bacterium]
MARRDGNRTIFITGAGAGIGAATAQRFASRGWTVGASDVDAAALAALQGQVGAGRLHMYTADVRDARALQAAVASFAEGPGGGRLDAVFANAGVLYMGPDATLTPLQKQLLIDVNVNGVVHTFDAAMPYLLRAAPGARAVAMASTSAEYGSPQHAVYGATKFFVRGYTEALDIEYRRAGLRVSGIYVSYVGTGMVTGANFRPASVDRLGVKATPEQVAGAVWRAVHGGRAHWRVGFDAKLTHYAVRLLGAWIAPIYAKITGA